MTSGPRKLRPTLLHLGWLVLAFSGIAQSAAPPAAADSETPDFDREIQPILRAHCYECHGPRKQAGGLRLDSRALAFRGGDSAEPGIVPGDSASSHILRALTGAGGVKQMPLDAEPLSAEEIGLIRRWIDAGAPWPAEENEQAPADPLGQTDHWSLKPVADPAIPEARSDAWCRNEVDAFVLQELRRSDLAPSPQADRRRLIRRVFFTLHGLVPTPEQMDRYLQDDRADWYPRMVDELLDSPRYGERWARHWLDTVRYAETSGFETNLPRPNAYRYRDYVIRAFNEDKPYDQFVMDQLAGDQTGEPVATGFIVAGPKDMVPTEDQALIAMQRSNELADMVNAASTTFMGLTVACARCHHHKFDPILHQDYYAMQAVFEGVQHGEREVELPGDLDAVADPKLELEETRRAIERYQPRASVDPDTPPTRPGVNAKLNIERIEPVEARYVRLTVSKTNSSLEPCIDELEVYATTDPGGQPVNVALASRGGVPSSSGEFGGVHQLSQLNDGQYGNEKSTIARGDEPWFEVDLSRPYTIDRIVWGRDRTGSYGDRLAVDYRIEVSTDAVSWQVVATSRDRQAPGVTNAVWLTDEQYQALKALEARRRQLEEQLFPVKAYAGVFEQPGPTHRLYRGDPQAPREVVAPDTLALLPSLDLPADAPEHERRLAFAKSLVDPEHPLTARVMVNRIWQYHFGEGLVSTPSDLGAMGATPTHPELLDYLARQFIENGWSVKHMHRLILNSSTFRQDSAPNDQAMRVDAESRLLWRFPPRRHEAEVIRDSLLRVTGKLDLTLYGPGFDFYKPNNNYSRVYEPKETFGPEDWRRMLYGTQVRMERDQTFGGFDCPDGGQPAPKRTRSTTALQALSLFNSPFVLQQAEFFADRLRKEAGEAPEAQVARAYALLYGREPDPQELRACVGFINEHGLAALCRVLVNTNEFLFVE